MSQDKPEDEREPLPSSPPPKAIKPTKPGPSKAQKRSSPNDEEDRARKRKKKSRPEPESKSDPEDARSPTPASSPEPPERVKESKSKSTKHKAAVKPKAANGRGPIDKVKQEDDNESSALSEPPSDLEPPNTNQAPSAAKAEDSDSELSVLDDDPKPKKKRKSSEATEGKSQKTKATKPRNDVDLDPDDVEIKRLQGWLVKCGIRKLWGKELKPYEGSKAKIKHLRSLLADVGMIGRYSIEKATQIKEARELAADIEAVQEGAERWGKDKDKDEPEDDGESRGKRRLVRGAKNYDFLSSDGEETD